jgi:DNA polymerase-3 subunit gamma/tau
MTTPYLVLARKYRPQRFSDLTGQEHVVRTLVNALKTGRVAHAFLFTGVRGVGKTTSARILAGAELREAADAGALRTPWPLVQIAAGNDIDVRRSTPPPTTASTTCALWRRRSTARARPVQTHTSTRYTLSGAAFNAAQDAGSRPPHQSSWQRPTRQKPATILPSPVQRHNIQLVPPGKIVVRGDRARERKP